MNILPLLALGLAGCAAPTEQLITEAKECVANYISPTGIMGKPTQDDKDLCWSDVNARMESEAKREARNKAEQPLSCPIGSVVACKTRSRTDKQCGCMRHSELERIFRGAGY